MTGRAASVVVVGALGIASACGTTTDGPAAPAEPTAATPNDTTPNDTTPNDTTPNDTTPNDAQPESVDEAALSALVVVAALGYPRDLLDRGRVNVKISRDDDTDVVILDKQLVADHFISAPVEQRRTILPPNGRVVALQTLFGEVADCDSTEPVTASLVVTYTAGDDPSSKTASIPFTDASTLDDIRAQKCTVRRVLADNEIELHDPVTEGEAMSIDLVIRRRTGAARLGFDSIKGTVLFGIGTRYEPGSPERVLESTETEAVIPLDVTVNRCDSHAVAETTRKYGLDLYVSVDGSEPRLVQIPVDPILGELEAMLDTCKARTGQ